MTLVAGYVRKSSREDEKQQLTLPAQKRRLAEECQLRGWQLAGLFPEAESTRRRRPELELLLPRLDAGDYDVLMVTRLDRVSRSTGEFAMLLDRANRNGWNLVMLDPAVDTTTPYGRAFAEMGAVFAQLERALISQRTKEGLAEARAQGTFRPGEQSRYVDELVIEQIMRWSVEGLGGDRIAARLNRQGTPSPRGGEWSGRVVRKIVLRNRLHGGQHS